MRSSIIQRQVKNNITYAQSPMRPQSQKVQYRPQSAKIASRIVRVQNYQNNDSTEEEYTPVRQMMHSNIGLNNSRAQSKPMNYVNNEDSPKDTSWQIGRQLLFDKEKLYQEQFQLKRTLHLLNDDNLKLKTKVQQLEGSLMKYEKLIQEVDNIGPTKPQFVKYTNEAHFINNLKKEIKQLKQQSLLKEEDIQKTKRSMKYTKIQELEIEKKGFSDETIRLKYLLEQTIQASLLFMSDNNVTQDVQEKLIQQSGQIQQLRLDKVELDQVIARLQKQCLTYKSLQIDNESKLNKEIKKLRGVINDKQKEIDSFRPQTKQVSKRTDEQYRQIYKENEWLRQQLEIKNKLLEESDKKLASANLESQRDVEGTYYQQKEYSRADFQQNLLKEERTKNSLGDDQRPTPLTSIIRKAINESITQPNSITNVVLSINPPQLRQTQEKLQKPASQERQKQNITQSASRKISQIQFHEVKCIGETLRYRLRAMKIDWKDIDNYVFSFSMNEQGFSTLGELRIHLQKFPFDLSLQNANLVAKYMVESENDNQPNDQMFQSNAIVKSVLRRVVGVYQIDELQDRLMRQRLSDTLFKYKTFIVDCFKNQGKQQSKNPIVTKSQFEECLIQMGLELTVPEIDFLIVQGILESQSVDHLNLVEMLKFLPDAENQKQRSLRSEQSNQITLSPPKQIEKVFLHEPVKGKNVKKENSVRNIQEEQQVTFQDPQTGYSRKSISKSKQSSKDKLSISEIVQENNVFFKKDIQNKKPLQLEDDYENMDIQEYNDENYEMDPFEQQNFDNNIKYEDEQVKEFIDDEIQQVDEDEQSKYEQDPCVQDTENYQKDMETEQQIQTEDQYVAQIEQQSQRSVQQKSNQSRTSDLDIQEDDGYLMRSKVQNNTSSKQNKYNDIDEVDPEDNQSQTDSARKRQKEQEIEDQYFAESIYQGPSLPISNNRIYEQKLDDEQDEQYDFGEEVNDNLPLGKQDQEGQSAREQPSERQMLSDGDTSKKKIQNPLDELQSQVRSQENNESQRSIPNQVEGQQTVSQHPDLLPIEENIHRPYPGNQVFNQIESNQSQDKDLEDKALEDLMLCSQAPEAQLERNNSIGNTKQQFQVEDLIEKIRTVQASQADEENFNNPQIGSQHIDNEQRDNDIQDVQNEKIMDQNNKLFIMKTNKQNLDVDYFEDAENIENVESERGDSKIEEP